MKKAWIGFFGAALIAAPAVLAGCNNASCTYASKCPNDGPTSAVEEFNNTTLCDNRKNDPNCGGAYGDYVSCFESNQACTGAGTTDYTVTDGICGAQKAKWFTCYYGIDGGGYADAAGE